MSLFRAVRVRRFDRVFILFWLVWIEDLFEIFAEWEDVAFVGL